MTVIDQQKSITTTRRLKFEGSSAITTNNRSTENVVYTHFLPYTVLLVIVEYNHAYAAWKLLCLSHGLIRYNRVVTPRLAG